jgi:hypothetical protein
MGTTNHSHSPAPGPVNHEVTDVNLTGVTRIAIASLIVLAVILAAVYGMMRGFEWNASDTRELPALSAYTPGTDRLPQVPATLLLQPDEPGALRQLRSEETKILEHYAWVDKGQGVVRIPIEKAMELIVEHPDRAGLAPAPVAAPAAAPESH